GKPDAVCIADLATGAQVGELCAPFSYARCFAWGPDGKLYTGDADGMVRAWDVATRAQVRAFKAHPLQVRTLHFLDGGQLFTAGTRYFKATAQGGAVTFLGNEDDHLKTWDPAAGKLLKTHAVEASAPVFAPNRRCVYALELNGKVFSETASTWDYVQRDARSM